MLIFSINKVKHVYHLHMMRLHHSDRASHAKKHTFHKIHPEESVTVKKKTKNTQCLRNFTPTAQSSHHNYKTVRYKISGGPLNHKDSSLVDQEFLWTPSNSVTEFTHTHKKHKMWFFTKIQPLKTKFFLFFFLNECNNWYSSHAASPETFIRRRGFLKNRKKTLQILKRLQKSSKEHF